MLILIELIELIELYHSYLSMRVMAIIHPVEWYIGEPRSYSLILSHPTITLA